MKKRRHFTLIEIMVVVALIGIIGGVLTYNLKGSLDKGKAFKTVEAKRQIKNILELEAAEKGLSLQEVATNWETIIERSPLTKQPKKLLQDGWNQKFDLSFYEDEIVIQSRKLQEYYKKHNIVPDPEDEPFM